ncbi:restriction endonuclease subunit S [Cupriavidus sp. AU9028]|uniref:restriction endonuclease subunit S n=1 Tax=Cupriavidus sp. AU9028 TaxID=2871157 RepID=UPI001C945FF4|nr:restriction endonuclease subunit S [Cupriavidus sp. AU9028]MBY4897224.1 restriction endonuclease subunit S [Cupriavidus sp. AU9028]
MSLSRNLSGCQVFHPSELPTDWDCVPLKDRLELLYGRALKEEIRKPGDVDVFGSNGKVGSHNEHWLDAPGVLVGRKGTVGAVHYTDKPFWPIDTTYYVKPTGDDKLRYLFYLLEQLPLKSLNAATGVPGLSRRDAYALLGAFPPPNEQAAIARVLDAVGAAIDRAREAAAQAAEVKRALAQELFSKGTRGEPQKKTPVGFIPASWEVKPVNAVVTNFEYGLSLPMHLKGATPILRMGNIQQGDVVMDDLKYVTLPDALVDRYLLKRGDVLFNRTNSQEWVGKVGIYRTDAPAVFASYLIRLHPDVAQVDNYYLGQLLNSYNAQCRIKRFATPGVQQVNINAKNLGKVLIPVPVGSTALDEQREIAAVLEAADERSRSYAPVIAALSQLKKSLMHDLLTGSVRFDPALFPQEANV